MKYKTIKGFLYLHPFLLRYTLTAHSHTRTEEQTLPQKVHITVPDSSSHLS